MNADRTAPQAPQNSAVGNGGRAIWLLAAVFAVGAVSLVYGLTSVEGKPDFPLFTSSFLYLMGISSAGVVFSAIMRLVKAQWAKPWFRLAEISTVAFFPLAILGYLLIFTFAREELFYWLTPAPDAHLSGWLDINWLFVRDIAGMLIFYGVSFLYARKSLRVDMTDGGDESAHREVEGQLYLLSPIVLLCFVLCHTFFAWDFAMMLIPHWHSTVFPIHFWFGNMFAGCAALMVFPALLGQAKFADSPLGATQVRNLGMLLTGFTLMWLYFFWAQFFVIWFGNLPHETGPLWRQMYGHYAPFFWAMIAGSFFIPFVAFIFAFVKRSMFAMCVIAGGINVGIWLNKYLMVVPVYSADHVPFDHWLDIAVALGFVAGYVLTVMFLAKKLPMYSRWEMNLKPISR